MTVILRIPVQIPSPDLELFPNRTIHLRDVFTQVERVSMYTSKGCRLLNVWNEEYDHITDSFIIEILSEYVETNDEGRKDLVIPKEWVYKVVA